MSSEVLVYQMGKVGSSSIKKTLRAHGFEVDHFHYFKGDFNTADNPPAARLGVETLAGGDWRIICPVRDPVARNVSAFFQNLDAYGLDKSDLTGQLKWFSERYPWRIPLDWFDKELKENTGLDVYNFAFNRSRGWSEIRAGGLRVLLLQVELPDEEKCSALSLFLNRDIPELLSSNVGDSKSYAIAYREFRDALKIEPNQLEALWTSKYVRHFYHLEQIREFRERWE